MRNIGQDLRIALRGLRRNPGFTAVAVATLSISIAANTTVFGWIDTILLHPIPGVTDAHQLLSLEMIEQDGGRLSSIPHPDFRDFQHSLTQMSGVIAAHTSFFTLGPVERPKRILGQVVSANFFAVLGVNPHLGRMLSPDEDRDDNGAFPLAVISHRLWRSYYRSDPGVVGRTERINGRQLTIVGVAPPNFHGTVGGGALDVWVPLSLVTQVGALNSWAAADRNARFLEVTVRAKPGVTLPQARAEVGLIAARIAAAYPDTHRGVRATFVPMWQASYGMQKTLRNPLRMLMAVCVLVLLIACANVANLLMARSVTRQREFGVRIALGAGHTTLVRNLLAEVAVLAGAGAVGGILLAQWMGESLAYVLPSLPTSIRDAIEPMLRVTPSWSVLAFTVLVTLAAALLSAILPALAVSRADLNRTLNEGGRSGTSGVRTHRARAALVIAEVALAAMALIGAGLAVRSFQRQGAINIGFDPRNVLVAQLHLSTNGYKLAQEKLFDQNLRRRLEAAPGIERVSYAESVPLSLLSPGGERVQVEGSSTDPNGVVDVLRSVVAPGYFDLMRIPLLAGRDFTEKDDLKTPAVIIVNETFARMYFGRQDPLGRKVRVSGKLSTVVGVVKDGKYRNPPEGPTPFFYGPFRQIFYSGHNNFVYIRTAGDLDAARSALRREVMAMDPAAAFYDALPLVEYTEAGLFAERIAAGLLSALGVLSLALAALGLYSVMAYAVSERTHEIGIRMALGAQRRSVLGMILWKGLAMTLTGLAAGLTTGVLGVRLLSSTLNLPVSLAEPSVFAAAAFFLLAVALLASYVPARRATRVDPLTTLRAE
jgi:predicted permease